jgi:hypothetical protein
MTKYEGQDYYLDPEFLRKERPKNLVGAVKARFFTPLRSVQNDRRGAVAEVSIRYEQRSTLFTENRKLKTVFSIPKLPSQ